MGFTRLNSACLLAAALALPAAASAQFDLTIDPERIDGAGFVFDDNVENSNNRVTFDVDGTTVTARGQVQDVAGGTVVTISWEIGFPDDMSASSRAASVAQDAQVLVSIFVDAPGDLNDYFGQAAPSKCKASAKIQDRGGPPDTPEVSQASLSCDLRRDFEELDDDDDAVTLGDPPQTAIDAIVQAFAPRKDVKTDAGNGKLTIKHKGRAAP
jgi:hypothetical protein